MTSLKPNCLFALGYNIYTVYIILYRFSQENLCLLWLYRTSLWGFECKMRRATPPSQTVSLSARSHEGLLLPHRKAFYFQTK